METYKGIREDFYKMFYPDGQEPKANAKVIRYSFMMVLNFMKLAEDDQPTEKQARIIVKALLQSATVDTFRKHYILSLNRRTCSQLIIYLSENNWSFKYEEEKK